MQVFLHCVCPPGMPFSVAEGEEKSRNPIIRGSHEGMGCHNKCLPRRKDNMRSYCKQAETNSVFTSSVNNWDLCDGNYDNIEDSTDTYLCL